MTPPTGLLTSATTEIKTKAKSGSCGCSSKTDTTTSLDEKIQARIAKHPCYSEEAHHHYARMHVAVAPACNIQCNYCNRKYDCANESRPGVVSELLTPEEAAHKVLVIAGKIPQMTVLGIAGPGDPLANPEKTFRTFELIAKKAPDIKLCLSTNGLMLPDYVDRIKQLNIDHVTITINMVDPEIGAKIYPWVHYRRKRYKGIEGVRILHEKQMESLQALQEQQDIELPFSCQSGSCSSCVAKVVEGQVDQSEQVFLDEEQMAKGFIVLCVSYPRSDCTIRTHQEPYLV
ncbi:MAG: radical SAM protein [Nostoc sp. TH1S01]|nr:radical SAM protein [Nostoc sp. TH1S01]